MERDVVRDIQSRFDSPAWCHWPGAQVAVKRVPGIGFGGDFHHVLHEPNDRFSIVVGTVRARGLSAAFAKALLSGEVTRWAATALSTGGLWDCLSHSLDRINADLMGNVRCAVFHGQVDRIRRQFEYRTVGRIWPVAVTTRREPFSLSIESGALDGTNAAAPRIRRIPLNGLIRLVICTEGFLEARSPEGNELRSVITPNMFVPTAGLDPEEQADAFIRKLREHVGDDHVCTDDATVFIVDFSESGSRRDTESDESWLRAKAEAIEHAPDSSIFIG